MAFLKITFVFLKKFQFFFSNCSLLFPETDWVTASAPPGSCLSFCGVLGSCKMLMALGVPETTQLLGKSEDIPVP